MHGLIGEKLPFVRNWKPRKMILIQNLKKNLENKKLNFLYFGYTSCPTECPVMMSVMRQLYDKIDTTDVAYYLITIDPEIDTKVPS